jgi:syntaxin 18
VHPRETASSSLSSSWFSLASPASDANWTSKQGVTPKNEHSSITIFDDDASSPEYQPEITPDQIQIFESENSELLKSMESELASVQRAETRLLEISALQSELVFHLSQQAEQAEQMYDDAIASTSMAEKGNVQLREAARRAKDSRLFILVFLLCSSFALLFLHFY